MKFLYVNNNISSYCAHIDGVRSRGSGNNKLYLYRRYRGYNQRKEMLKHFHDFLKSVSI